MSHLNTPILQYSPFGGKPSGGGTVTVGQRVGNFLYWPDVQRLTGGTSDTDLDAQDISALLPLTMIEVKIPGRGASQWLRTFDAGSTPTNTDAGIIKPLNYDAAIRPYILYRQAGF